MGVNNLLSFLALRVREISLLFVLTQSGGMEITMNGKIETKTIVKIFLAVFALLLLIFYRKNISEFFGAVISASTPLFIGCAAAYVLNILMGFYERHFFPKSESCLPDMRNKISHAERQLKLQSKF